MGIVQFLSCRTTGQRHWLSGWLPPGALDHDGEARELAAPQMRLAKPLAADDANAEIAGDGCLCVTIPPIFFGSDMRHDLYRIIGFVLVTIVGLLGIAAFMHVLVTLPFQGKGPEWVGAIGTIGTLIGTIWLATSETRQRNRERLLVARLHAAGMFWRLIGTHALITTLSEQFESSDARGLMRILSIWKQGLGELELWTVSDLVPLAALPNNTAAKLAEVADRVTFVRAMIDRMERGSPDYVLALQIPVLLADAVHFLQQAIDECRACAIALRGSAEQPQLVR